MHDLSICSANRLITVNYTALPDNLLESEMLKYKVVAFTDAMIEKPGRSTIADHGAIFLVEIDDISPAMQG